DVGGARPRGEEPAIAREHIAGEGQLCPGRRAGDALVVGADGDDPVIWLLGGARQSPSHQRGTAVRADDGRAAYGPHPIAAPGLEEDVDPTSVARQPDHAGAL